MRRTRIVVLLSAAVLLTACGSATEDETLSEGQIERLAGEAEAAGYVEQSSILEDGTVTAEEYEVAVDNYAGCVEEYGYTVSERVTSPVDGLLLEYVTDVGGFDQDEASANIQACSERHVPYVERAYLGSHEARMDGPLLRALDACVSERGVQTTGNETQARDFFELEGMNPAMLSECINEAAHGLYPDLPSLSVSF